MAPLVLTTPPSPGLFWTWDPTNSGPNYTFDPPNVLITGKTGGTGFQSAATTGSRSSGKYYWEIVWTTLNTGCGQCYGTAFGDISSVPVGGRFGVFANEYLWQEAGAASGSYFHNNIPTVIGIGFVQGDVVMTALDISTIPGKVWWGKNGAWNAGGNPAAGTGAIFSDVPAGNYTPGVSIWAINPDVSVTGQFASSDLTFAPPAGFSAIGD